MGRSAAADRSNWSFKRPFDILMMAKNRNNEYKDLNIEGLKEMAKAYLKASVKQGVGGVSNLSRAELALMWDNILGANGISSDSAGFRAICISGDSIVSKRLTNGVLKLYADPPECSSSSSDMLVSNKSKEIIENDSGVPAPPVNVNALDQPATKADFESMCSQFNNLTSAMDRFAAVADRFNACIDKVEKLETRLESVENAGYLIPGDLSDLNSRVNLLETEANLKIDPRMAYQEFLRSKGKFFDLADRAMRDGLLEVYIKNVARYTIANGDNEVAINDYNLSNDLRTQFVILNKSKTRSNAWKLKLKIVDTEGISAVAIMKHLLNSRSSFKGNLGLSLSLPEELESYKFTWWRWEQGGIITCFDYSKVGGLFLYLHDPELGELASGMSINQRKNVSKMVRIYAPDHLALLDDPSSEKLLKLADSKYFVFRGRIFERPETQTANPQAPVLPQLQISEFGMVVGSGTNGSN